MRAEGEAAVAVVCARIQWNVGFISLSPEVGGSAHLRADSIQIQGHHDHQPLLHQAQAQELLQVKHGHDASEQDGSLTGKEGDKERSEWFVHRPPSPSLLLPATMASSSRLNVGYALTAKKTESFLKPTLLALARNRGIAFVLIDVNRPLIEQGPFDVILHKRFEESWNQQLKAYKQRNPEVVILDPPEAIKKVYNRQSMLQEVAALNFSHSKGYVRVPRQVVVNGEPSSISEKVSKAGLKFPLVAKPLYIDATANSHALSLAYNAVSLSELRPPLVLQEFVNHGGVLFKVFIMGHIVKVVRRLSLSDVNENQCRGGITPFPRVSCATASADGQYLDPIVSELPPSDMLESLSKELRFRLGLSLFNLDMIRKGGKGNEYYIIDINYFPGFGKLPGYEALFTEYLSTIAQRKRK